MEAMERCNYPSSSELPRKTRYGQVTQKQASMTPAFHKTNWIFFFSIKTEQIFFFTFNT